MASPPISMSVANNELLVDGNGLSEANAREKPMREVKLRSKAWEHFTKVMKEDGTYAKCKCNHCNRLFTCSNKSGTTHLLRHITEGICPAYKNGKIDRPQTFETRVRGSSEPRSSTLSWKFEERLDPSAQETVDVLDELLPVGLDDLEHEKRGVSEDDCVGQTSKRASAKFPGLPPLKRQATEESWIKELHACARKLVDLTNERPLASTKKSSTVPGPDYSISTAVRILNEMEDIQQSSEMYLDAFELLRDEHERECFICLPPDPRRRWLQRMLHRLYPLTYMATVNAL